LNFLLFTDNLTEVFEQQRDCLLLSASNKLTGWYLEIPNFTSFNIEDIDITLKGKTDIDFKTIIQSNQLFSSNGIIYFKGSLNFTTTLSGIYYLEITDGISIIYSNAIFFSSQNSVSLGSDYVSLYIHGNTSFSMNLKGSGNVIVDFGNGVIEDYDITDTTITQTYSSGDFILKMSGVNLITDFTCNNVNVYRMLNESNFLILENVDIAQTQISSFRFQDFTTLLNVDIENTLIGDINSSNPSIALSGISRSDVLTLNQSNVSLVDTGDIATLRNSLEELYLNNCNLTSIVAYREDSIPYSKLEIVELSYNLFNSVPRVGLNQANVLSSPIAQWILSNNDIRYTAQNVTYLNPFIKGVTEKIDLKNNAISVSGIDLILETICEFNPNLDGLYLDLSGASPISGIPMGIPTDGIRFYNIVDGGSGYQLNDILTVTSGSGQDAVFYVSEIGVGGVITKVTATNAGSGYYQMENFTGGSGTLGNIEFYSSRVLLVMNGVELYTNAANEVEVLENTILGSGGVYVKDSYGNYIQYVD